MSKRNRIRDERPLHDRAAEIHGRVEPDAEPGQEEENAGPVEAAATVGGRPTIIPVVKCWRHERPMCPHCRDYLRNTASMGFRTIDGGVSANYRKCQHCSKTFHVVYTETRGAGQ